MIKPLLLPFLVLLALSLCTFVMIPHEEVISPDSLTDEPLKAPQNSPIATADDAFIYEVGPRFIATVTKEKLDQAFFVRDILPERANWDSHSVQELRVTLLKGVFEPTESSKGLILNEAQMKLLRSVDYSDDLKFVAHCKGKSFGENVEEYGLTYFLTVLPEQEASYSEGPEGFTSYLRENSRDAIAVVDSEDLYAGQIQFTILTNGRISNVNLVSTSGYDSVDETMLELIKNAPGSWEPASNSRQMKVEQKLTFFYGIMGC